MRRCVWSFVCCQRSPPGLLHSKLEYGGSLIVSYLEYMLFVVEFSVSLPTYCNSSWLPRFCVQSPRNPILATQPVHVVGRQVENKEQMSEDRLTLVACNRTNRICIAFVNYCKSFWWDCCQTRVFTSINFLWQSSFAKMDVASYHLIGFVGHQK